MQKQNNLRQIRKKLGFALLELMATSGISTSTLVAIERYGLYPATDVRTRLSKALGVSELIIWPNGHSSNS